MIETLHGIATILQRLRLPLGLLALVSLVLALGSVFELGQLSIAVTLVPSLLALIWAVDLYSLSYLFMHIPPRPQPGMGFFLRLRLKIKRFGMWLLALMSIVLGLSLIYLTFQQLRFWSGAI